MKIGLIATSSLSDSAVLGDTRHELVATRYGDVRVEIGAADEGAVLVRRAGRLAPPGAGADQHRAIVLALRELGVGSVLSTCVVGSLTKDLPPGSMAVLSQFLDFTPHRPPTLFDDHGFYFTDMSEPYCPRLRTFVRGAANAAELPVHENRCYVGVDGPRYETAAEVRMFGMLGGDVVGHTGVAEAITTSEAGLCHASVALVSGYAAGLTDRPMSNEEVDACSTISPTRSNSWWSTPCSGCGTAESSTFSYNSIVSDVLGQVVATNTGLITSGEFAPASAQQVITLVTPNIAQCAGSGISNVTGPTTLIIYRI